MKAIKMLFVLAVCCIAWQDTHGQNNPAPQALQTLQHDHQPAKTKVPCLTTVSPAQRNMELQRDRQNYDLLMRRLMNSHSRAAIDFRIQIHIVRRSDGTGGISPAVVRSEIENFVNPYYENINVSFIECGPENYIDDDTYYSLSGIPEGNVMSATHNVPNVFNIYFVGDAAGACGWARFPSDLPEDYIVIDNVCADNQSTLVHEIGHYFDLYHTHETMFGDENVTRNTGDACYNCRTTGDLLCDTDADPRLNRAGVGISGAPTCNITSMPFQDNCTPAVTYTPDPFNIMSYSLKACRTVFTDGQFGRMLVAIHTTRDYLLTGPCPCPDEQAPEITCAEDVTVDANMGMCGAVVHLPGGERTRFEDIDFVNDPGGGPGGMDASQLQNSSLGMITFGFGAQGGGGGNRVVEDFSLAGPAGAEVTIDSIQVFGYMTGGSVAGSFNSVNYRIWDGPPGGGGSIIYGDLTTNRLQTETWTGVYRTSETTITTERPIMALNLATPNLLLDANTTYYIEWEASGTGISGPWANPITINGVTTTGNSLRTVDGVTYTNTTDDGTSTQQGLPLIVSGFYGAVDATDPCGIASLTNDYNGSGNATDIYPLGNTTVTWTATDNDGNTANCSMTVTVVDNTDPIILDEPCGSSDANATVYDDGWQTGDNDGTGFGPWTLTTTSANPPENGHFRFFSVANGDGDDNGDGDIDGGGFSWGMFANNGQKAEAIRPLSNPLVPGSRLAFKMDNGFIDPGGFTGIKLFDGSGNYLWGFGFTGGDTEYRIDQQGGSVGTGIPFTDEGISIEIVALSLTSIEAVIVPLNGPGATTVTSSLISPGPIEELMFENFNSGIGPSFDFYFNQLNVCYPGCVDADTIVTDPGVCTGTMPDMTAGIQVWDNCSASLSQNPAAGTAVALGTHTVTITATDGSGNTSTCETTITIEDNEPPMAVCKKDTVYLDANGVAFLTASQFDGGSTDNCGTIDSMAIHRDSVTCENLAFNLVPPGPRGRNVVYFTVWDESGNSASCFAEVTVFDTTAPTAVCKDITVALDASGNASITGLDIDDGSTDNCAIVGWSAWPNSFTCADVGANTVILTVHDSSGNTATCASTVTIVDNTPPAALCKDITVQLDGSGQATITGADIDDGSTDNCGIQSLTASQTAFDCSHVGSNIVVLTVTDLNGNTATCMSTVTVEDNVPPVAMCKDITVQLDANGEATIVPGDVDDGSTDNCGVAGMSVSQSNFGCGSAGNSTVVLTVTDVNGNTATCSATVTVADTVPPIALCQDITVYLDANDEASIDPADIDDGSTDNCTGGITYFFDDFESGTGNWTADQVEDTTCVGNNTDNRNNWMLTTNPPDTSTWFGIASTGQDPFGQGQGQKGQGGFPLPPFPGQYGAEASGISCPPFIAASDTVHIDFRSFSNNESGFLCLYDVELVEMSLNGGAWIPVHGYVTGLHDDSDSTIRNHSFSAPVTPGDQVRLRFFYDTGDDCCGPEGPDIGWYVDDVHVYSSGQTVALSASQTEFDCSYVGTNTVVLTVTDPSGNTATCTSTVTVMDTAAPTAVCKDITVMLDANGEATITGADIDDGSFDNCNLVSWTASPDSFNASHLGANTVVLTVTDQGGNTATCTSTVTVVDDSGPVALCKDITVQLGPNGWVFISGDDIDDGSYDNDGIYSLAASPNYLTCGDIGANTVVLTVTDVNGNTATCESTVTVEDNMAPTVLCKDATAYLDANGEVTITGSLVNDGSHDNCSGISLSVSPSGFDCADVGANTVVLTVTDQSGNTATCSATVTVTDTMPPVIIGCPEDIAILQPGPAFWTPPTAGSGCGVTMTSTHNPGDHFPRGVTQVVYTATDPNGNTTTCTFNVRTRGGYVRNDSGDGPTGVEVSQAEALKLEIWPNPTTNTLHLDLSQDGYSGKVNIELYDLLGRKVHATVNTLDDQLTQTLDIGHLAGGQYMLRIRMDASGETITRKVIVVR